MESAKKFLFFRFDAGDEEASFEEALDALSFKSLDELHSRFRTDAAAHLRRPLPNVLTFAVVAQPQSGVSGTLFEQNPSLDRLRAVSGDTVFVFSDAQCATLRQKWTAEPSVPNTETARRCTLELIVHEAAGSNRVRICDLLCGTVVSHDDLLRALSTMFDTKGWRLFQRVESDQQARRLDCRSFGTYKDAVSGFWAPFQRFAVVRDDQLELVAERMLVASADTLLSFDDVGQIRMRLRVGRKVWARVLEKTDAREGSKATDELLQRLKEGFLARRATDCGPVRNEHEIPCEDPVMGKVVQAFATFNPRHGLYGKIVKATSIVDIQLELHDEDMTLSENALHMSRRWLAHFAGLAGRIPYLSRKVVQARLKKIGERYLNDELLRRVDKEFFRPWYAENAASAPASGMVFYGPAGTGKSEIINQFCEPEDGGDPDGKMSAMGFYVIRVTGAASLLKPYSGQTQELMRMLAEEALKRPHQMCVLALDEYEAIAEDRDLVKQDYKAGYVGQLLAIIGQRKYPNLCVWAATNFFSKLDVALLREGRQEAHFLLGPLSAQEAFATAKNVLSRPPAQKAVQSWTQAHENGTLDDLCWLIVPHALNFTVSQLVRVLAQAVDFWTFETESGKIQDLSFLIAQEFRKKLSMRCPENLRFNKLVSSTLTSIPRETLVGLYSHISRCRSRGRCWFILT